MNNAGDVFVTIAEGGDSNYNTGTTVANGQVGLHTYIREAPIPDTEKEIIALMEDWERFADEQSTLHNNARIHYKTFNYLLAIPAIVISTVSGTGNIGVSTSSCSGTILSIVFGSLALVAASMFSVHRYMNLPELQQMHDFYSDTFFKLANDIRFNIIVRNHENRAFISLVEFAKDIKKNIDICVDKAPSVPKQIINQEVLRKGHSIMEGMTLRKRNGGTPSVAEDKSVPIRT